MISLLYTVLARPAAAGAGCIGEAVACSPKHLACNMRVCACDISAGVYSVAAGSRVGVMGEGASIAQQR